VGDVAKETEAQYCTEHINVNGGATWIESEWSYPERSGTTLVCGNEPVNAYSDVNR
jgi:hypothetical protein